MARPKLEEKKKVMYRVFVPRSYIPVLDQVIKNLNEAGMAEQILQASPIPQNVEEEKPIKKSSFGVDFKDWLKEHNAEMVDVTTKESEQKDYTAWQQDPLAQDIYNSCLWECGAECQEYPEGVEKYQMKYRSLWVKLTEAKRNNKTQKCNEIMTEMMERIYNE